MEIRYGGFRSWPVGVKTGIITIGGSFAILSNINVHIISTQQTHFCVYVQPRFLHVWVGHLYLSLFFTALLAMMKWWGTLEQLKWTYELELRFFSAWINYQNYHGEWKNLSCKSAYKNRTPSKRICEPHNQCFVFFWIHILCCRIHLPAFSPRLWPWEALWTSLGSSFSCGFSWVHPAGGTSRSLRGGGEGGWVLTLPPCLPTASSSGCISSPNVTAAVR